MKSEIKNKGLLPSKDRIIVSAIVAMVFTIVMIWGYQLEKYGKIAFGPIFISVFVFNLIVLLMIYKCMDMWRDSFNASKHSDSRLFELTRKPERLFLILAGLLFFIYFIQYLGVYPGLFVFDAGWQLQMYDWGMISEHHPVLHTVLIGWLVKILKTQDGSIEYGVAAYVILQMIAFVFAESYLLCYIYGKLRSVLLLILGVLYFGLHPTIVLHVMSVTKDSLFAAFFILLLPLTIELIKDTGRAGSTKKLMLWSVAAVLITILRNNCIYAVPVLFVGVLICASNKKKAALFICISVLLFAAYKLIFVPMFVTDAVDGREMLSVPSNQLAAVYNNDEAVLSEEDRAFIEKLINAEGLSNYNPRIADRVKAQLNMDYCRDNLGDVCRNYLSIVRKNPGLMFREFLYLTEGFWYPGYKDYQITYKDSAYWIVDCYEPAVLEPKINVIYDYYKKYQGVDFVTRNPVLMFILSPGTYFLVLILMLGYSVIGRAGEYISILAFVFVFWLTYLLGPVALVRYTGYLYVMIPFYALLILFKESTDN